MGKCKEMNKYTVPYQVPIKYGPKEHIFFDLL